MKHITATLLLSSLFFGAPAISLAGAGHDHGHSHEEISSADAQTKATQKVKHLVDTKKIEATWAEIKPDSINQKDYGHGPEWVITFKNDKISDASKQTLYLFYSQNGHYIAANYDGN